MQEAILFSDLIAETKDGEWGEGQEAPGHVLCDVIRGTDFAGLNAPGIELPQRWIPEHLVARKALAADDILIETAGGTAKQSTGRTALITKEFLASREGRPVLCSSFARHLRVDQAKAHPVYLYYVLQALYASGYMGVFNLQHTGVARFQFTAFRTKTRLTLHENDAQPKIAATLRSYDDLIANNQRRIALLESMAEEIYREWFSRKRANRACLRLIRFDKLCKFEKGKNPTEIRTAPAEDWLPYLTADVLDGGAASEWVPIARSVVAAAGEVMMLMDGARSGSVFRGPAGVVASTVAVIRTSHENQGIVYHYLQQMQDAIKWNNTGSAIPHANKDFINRMLIPVPADEAYLHAFNKLHAPIYLQAQTLRQVSARLRHQRDALLPRLISGKLRVEALDIQFPPSMQPPPAEAAPREAIAR